MRVDRASRNFPTLAASAAAALLLLSDRAEAGPTQRACLMSERSPGAATCSCIQSVADQTLSRREQQRAASIIANPDMMDDVTADRRPATRSFLERYRRWGEYAQQYCS